jgi:hypothetical protein
MAGLRIPTNRNVQNERMSSFNKGIGATPALRHVYAAREFNKITEEEAKNLNPYYDPNKKYGKDQKNSQKNQHRQFSEGSGAFRPNNSDVQLAYDSGHIDDEQAKDLNPGWSNNRDNFDFNRSFLRSKITPTLKNFRGIDPLPIKVAEAVKEKHITPEEANELHPNWDADHNRARTNQKINKKTGYIPSLQNIHAAVENRKITFEEATSLNSKYNPTNKKQGVHLKKYNKLKAIKASGEGKTPSLINVHRAYKQGHIQEDEATSLNPKYDLSNKAKIKDLNSALTKQDSGYNRAYEAKKKNSNVGQQFFPITGEVV